MSLTTGDCCESQEDSRVKSLDSDEQKVPNLHIIFNHATGAKLRNAYRRIFCRHMPDIKFILTACLQKKFYRAPPPRVCHKHAPREALCSDIAGPLHSPGPNGEKCTPSGACY